MNVRPFLLQRIAAYKRLLGIGALLGIGMGLLKWIQWQYWMQDLPEEGYVGGVALLFLGVGAWISRKLPTPAVSANEPAPQSLSSTLNLSGSDLSARETEVLLLLAQGRRNAEIADLLCISISTVKTHVSNILLKLEANTRTQALIKARERGILP